MYLVLQTDAKRGYSPARGCVQTWEQSSRLFYPAGLTDSNIISHLFDKMWKKDKIMKARQKKCEDWKQTSSSIYLILHTTPKIQCCGTIFWQKKT